DIESLREFDIDTQTSVRDLNSVHILLSTAVEQGGAASPAAAGPGGSGDRPSFLDDQTGKVRDYIAPDHLQIGIEWAVEGGAPATPGSQELIPPQIQISEGWIGG